MTRSGQPTIAAEATYLELYRTMVLIHGSVVGAGGRFGAIHSQMPASWFMGCPA